MAIIIENKNYVVLDVLNVGWEDCKPNHSFKYAYTDFYLIHYVAKGCGVVCHNGEAHPVRAGEIFIIKPGGVYQYTADEENPWEYIWIAIRGSVAQRFEELDIVEPFKSNLFFELTSAESLKSTRTEYLTGKAFEIFSVLFENRKYQSDYVKSVSDYVKANYMRPLSVEEIAAGLNINRRYLSRIFKEQKGVTLQQYIINYKIKIACEFLNRGFRVSDTAQMVGYDDSFTFSKIFKKNMGVSPKSYSGEG